jgi:hypothetical protein
VVTFERVREREGGIEGERERGSESRRFSSHVGHKKMNESHFSGNLNFGPNTAEIKNKMSL